MSEAEASSTDQLEWSIPERVTAGIAAAAVVLSLCSFWYTHEQTARSDEFSAEELLNRAWAEVRQEDLEAASDLIYLAEIKDEDSFRAPAYRGYVQHIRGASSRALPYLRESLEREPNYYIGHVFLGNTQRELRAFDAATRSLESALTLATRGELKDAAVLSTIYLSLGHVRQRQGFWAQALAFYLKAIEENPSSSEARLSAADMHFEMHVAAPPDDPEKRPHLARSLRIYDEVLQQEPREASHWAAVGRILYLTGNLAAAERAMRRSLELEPRAPGHDLLALAVREQGREAEADLILEQSWRLRDLR